MQGDAKRALARGDLAVGTFVYEFATLGIGRLAASAGAQFIIYDTEHTGWSWETIASVVTTTRPTGSEAFVRVPMTQRSYVSRALDMGATGLLIPMMESAAQAAEVVRWAKYPPDGVRGAAFGVGHDDYATGGSLEYMRRINADLLVMTQIETVRGLDTAEAIAAVDGVDVLWVGQFDLTNSMGIPAQFDHPRYLEALDHVSSVAAENGKAAGFMAGSPEEAALVVDKGYRIIAYSGDLWIYRAALTEGIAKTRAHGRG